MERHSAYRVSSTATEAAAPQATYARVRFAPDQAGTWSYQASFCQGNQVAIDLRPDAGSPIASDGATGTFTVEERDAAADGFLKWGRLEYVGKHYLKFRDGPYWIRGGIDTPENFLAYAGFDDTIPPRKEPSSKQYARERFREVLVA